MTPQRWLVFAIVLLAGALALLVERLLRRRKEARAYLKGVRYVLSDDPDGAIAVLSDAARLGTPEAVDTYLALGALFRRTGDLARAIRLHRNMLLRPGLDPARRVEVERELAHDYRRGGMLEEALAAYRPLADGGDRPAREGLRDVLVALERLAEAAAVQRLLSAPGEDRLLAHLLAAQARLELRAGGDRGLAAARAAVDAAPGSADALLAVAEVEGAAGRPAAARRAIASALAAEPEAALLAWPAAAAAGDRAALLRDLEERLARAPGAAAIRYLYGRLLHLDGRTGPALAELQRALGEDGSGEVTLAVREFLQGLDAPTPEDLAARHDLMAAALARPVEPIRCARCSAEVLTRQWRCKRCGAFDTLRQAPPPG